MPYISNTKKDQESMLKVIGVDSIDDLFKDIPKEKLLNRDLMLPKALSELELLRHLKELSSKNKIDSINFLGAGSYRHFSPVVVSHLAFRSEFYTAYTPYQPEVSQGSLQAIYEFQSMMCELTGMDIANASLYDGASALAESMLMAVRIKSKKQIAVSDAVHPYYREVLKTYANANSIKVTDKANEDTAAVIVQSPNFFGNIEDLDKISETAHKHSALCIACVIDGTSMGILKTPGECGVDIVAGEGQSFGLPVNYGGPYVGYIAAKQEFMRRMPGRLIGKTIDSKGKDAYVLTLQAREQHIRRDKATSNICTNQALCALIATIHLAAVGKKLKDIALQNISKAKYAHNELIKLNNVRQVFDLPRYNEFVIEVDDSKPVLENLSKNNISGGVDISKYYPVKKNQLLFCVTEANTKEEIDQLVQVVGGSK